MAARVTAGRGTAGQVTAAKPVARAVGAARAWGPAVAAALVVIALASLEASRANAQETIEVRENTLEYTYAQQMTFTLEATSSTPIEDIVLRYTVGGNEPVNRRVPEFDPGPHILARHTEDLLRGQIPPATEIKWWWTLTDDSGETTGTEPRSVRYMDDSFGWRSVDEEGLRVWWYGDLKSTAHDVAGHARSALDRVSELVGSRPSKDIQIVVFASQDDMRSSLAPRGATYESRLATLGARVAPDILILDAGSSGDQLADVVAHELSHMVVHQRIDRDYLDLPLWLDEGLAMYTEGPLDDDEQALLDKAVAEDDLMSVKSLTSFPGQAERVPLAYAESRDIVAFLIETHGIDEFQLFLDTIADGDTSPDEALQEVYGFDELGLYQAYRASLDLPPAEPVDSAAAGRVRPPRRVGEQGTAAPCAALILVLPAMAAAWMSRRSATTTG